MPNRRRAALPAVILAIGLIGSLAAALLIARVEQGRHEARFEGLADGAVAAVESRMLAQLTLLRGMAGFFYASEEIRRDEFEAYVNRLRLDEMYPGVLGLGYAEYHSDRAGLARLEAQVRASGEPGFRAWPAGERRGYSSIVFLEPMNRMNRAALGYDMLSEPTRRQAMEAAMATGLAYASGRVRLVQEIDPVKQPGFLIYLPLTHGSGSFGRSTRPADLRGWVYSPLRAHDLFQAVFADHDMSGIAVEIFDQAVAEENLLYRSGAVRPHPGLVTSRELDVAGRNWVIRISSSPLFDAQAPRTLPLTVATAGALIALLLALLMRQQIRAAALTEREVELRTAELTEANRRLSAEAEAREQAEAQLSQMQKMRAIGQLTGGIAHDFNNMLAVVIGNLDMAQRRLDRPDDVAKSIGNALDGARKAADLTQRLLAFGRQQARAPQVVEVDRLVGGMMEMLRRTLGEHVLLDVRLEADGARVFADPVQLESAILNLAINGRDAMPHGGTLTIATRIHADAVEGVPLPAPLVAIEVADTGHGMSEDVIARALEPFFTTKEVGKGTGLGLSQVYGFTEQSGGHLALDSRAGEGTSVRIYLPVSETGAAAPVEADAADDLLGRSERVLVVEDEAQVRAMSAEALRELGYRVIEAQDGAQALKLLAQDAEVDLLFTDMVMPGLSGPKLAERARALRPGLKVLFTTGYAREEVVPEDIDAPTLAKPFTAAELAACVREALDKL